MSDDGEGKFLAELAAEHGIPTAGPTAVPHPTVASPQPVAAEDSDDEFGEFVVAQQPVIANAQMVLGLLADANVALPPGVTLSTRASFADLRDPTASRNANAYGVVLPNTTEVLLNESWLQHWRECNVSGNIVSTARHEATHAVQHRDGDTSSLDLRELEAYLCEIDSARAALTNQRFAELPTLRQVGRAREAAAGHRQGIGEANDTSPKVMRLCTQFDAIAGWWPDFEAAMRESEEARGTYDGLLEPFRSAQMAFHAAYEAQNEKLLRLEIGYHDAGQPLQPHRQKIQMFLQDIPDPPGDAFRNVSERFEADMELTTNWWRRRGGNPPPPKKDDK
jgi:hypothetical protein